MGLKSITAKTFGYGTARRTGSLGKEQLGRGAAVPVSH